MSNQNSILLIDPAFNSNTTITCSLLVKIGIDSFSYAILNKDTKKISAVFDEQECVNPVKKLSERLKSDPNLNLQYASIKIAVYTENKISVPDFLFDKDNLSLHTKFFPPAHATHLYTSGHSNFGFTTLFSFSKLTEKIINQSLASAKKYELNAPVLKLAETLAADSLIMDFTAGSIQILYKKDNQIVFQHNYEIENIEELNYYILLIIDQLNINLNKVTVYICGIIHDDDEKFKCLTQYFKEIHFHKVVNFNLDHEIIEDMPSHYYTSLLALDQCE